MASTAHPLAQNVRRLRRAAGLGVAELARQSGVARATLTQLEAGQGNPTLETLYAIANQLQVPLADLIAEAPPPAAPRVVPAGTGPHVSGAAVAAWLLHQARPAGQSIEIYALSVAPGVAQLSGAHPPGTREALHVHAGRLRAGPRAHPVELGPGDYAEYAADAPHVYEALAAGPADATLVIIG